METEKVYRWKVIANEGQGKRKDRRIVRATTVLKALAIAKARRGWGAKKSVTATKIEDD